MTSFLFTDSQIAAIAAQAKAALPAAVNGRLEKAVRLVRSSSVELHEDGSAVVISESDGLTGYLIANGRCNCPDFIFQPSEVAGWCCHKIARALVLRLQRQAHNTPRMPQETPSAAQASAPTPENDDPAWHMQEPSLDDIGTLGAIPPHPPRTVAAEKDRGAHEPLQTSGKPDASSAILSGFSGGSTPPLPEAPASINCRLMIAGRECQLTLRDTDETRLLHRLDAVLRRFPVETPALVQPSSTTPQPPACKWHGAMRESTKVKGTWFCPARMADGSYCTERWPAKDGGRRS